MESWELKVLSVVLLSISSYIHLTHAVTLCYLGSPILHVTTRLTTLWVTAEHSSCCLDPEGSGYIGSYILPVVHVVPGTRYLAP